MQENASHRPARCLAWIAALLLAVAGCGGETVVSGVGNSGNVIGANVTDRLAHELAEAPAIPAVSDDDLRAAFAAIRARAVEGDAEAALVLLRVAAHQREKTTAEME
jgi:hypothetical protein